MDNSNAIPLECSDGLEYAQYVRVYLFTIRSLGIRNKAIVQAVNESMFRVLGSEGAINFHAHCPDCRICAVSSGIQKHSKFVGASFSSCSSRLSQRPGVVSLSSKRNTWRFWISKRYGLRSYSYSPSFRTILKSFSPVSSPASRNAASSGFSPGLMLPAGTWMPTSSYQKSTWRNTSIWPSLTI